MEAAEILCPKKHIFKTISLSANMGAVSWNDLAEDTVSAYGKV